MKVAAITGLRRLEKAVAGLQAAFQAREQEFAGIVKVGRTQLQDACPTTIGATCAAWADALGRDRWRVVKCEERLRVVNLGGTAIGTGLTAPREYIFHVVDTLREVTGMNLARAENLVDATQNADAFVEVSGILKAHAVNLFKISSDLRLLASGPHAGIGEFRLPAVQVGSSVMPGKVNPVICEAVGQAALQTMANDQTVSLAAQSGQLELNAFLPLLAHALLGSLDLLERADTLFRVGEWVAAGQPVVSLLPPSQLKARFFVPEAALAQLHGGAAVRLSCDGCGAPITAHVSRIATEPEYTPPVIYSNEQRAKLVFMVEARPDAQDAARLKPGQPLDVQAGSAAPHS